MSTMSTYNAFKANFSAAETADEHFQRCWAEQACGGCLNNKGCSWCPWSCVPNESAIPMLAPAFHKTICPHPDERWEIRTRPLGCGVSSGTALAIAVTALATLAAVLIVAAAVLTVRRIRDSGQKVMSWEWTCRWKRVLFPRRGGRADDSERDPLLSP
ncbi:hypothetical protein M440DRAFT_1187332 [Trichoderma longibrachiatum ATCC 18648]|uniref:PSI domain-containing protein n=1 Tax=Trichoderma longibrachiatum ATCC 18648 TaxID=983965 RepID=A0A2T4C9F7_TRILO|nr:hypothetical protein M440DRAFT_1187332 [Trichoderma longibrachiatum ATCC 18648]